MLPIDHSTPFVTLTTAARQMIFRTLADEGEEGDCLRISATQVGGNVQYALKFDGKKRTGDVILQSPDFTVLIGQESIEFLRGVLVDYGTFQHGTGFRFTRTKNGVGS